MSPDTQHHRPESPKAAEPRDSPPCYRRERLRRSILAQLNLGDAPNPKKAARFPERPF